MWWWLLWTDSCCGVAWTLNTAKLVLFSALPTHGFSTRSTRRMGCEVTCPHGTRLGCAVGHRLLGHRCHLRPSLRRLPLQLSSEPGAVPSGVAKVQGLAVQELLKQMYLGQGWGAGAYCWRETIGTSSGGGSLWVQHELVV